MHTPGFHRDRPMTPPRASVSLPRRRVGLVSPVLAFHMDDAVVAALVARAALDPRPASGERGELHVEYQPIVDLASGALHAVEALARWWHPRWGPVCPATFIPAAERSGAIVPLGLR